MASNSGTTRPGPSLGPGVVRVSKPTLTPRQIRVPGHPRTRRIPPKGPKRAQHYRRQSVACTGRKLLSGYGRCQKGYHPGLPGIYSQDV